MTGNPLAAAVQRERDVQVAAAVAAERERIAATLRFAAAGRREYAEPIRNAPALADAVAFLDQEAATLDAAARVVEGDLQPLYGWLPSRRWTDEMAAALNGDEAPGSPAFERGPSSDGHGETVSARKPLDAYPSDQTGVPNVLRAAAPPRAASRCTIPDCWAGRIHCPGDCEPSEGDTR